MVVEHRLARLVQLGIRQSRYFGRVKTRFQLYLAATVANLTLVAGKLGRSGRTGGGATGRSVVFNIVPFVGRPCCGQFLRGPARTTVVRDPAHVGFTAQIPLPNRDFPARFLVLQRRVMRKHAQVFFFSYGPFIMGDSHSFVASFKIRPRVTL